MRPKPISAIISISAVPYQIAASGQEGKADDNDDCNLAISQSVKSLFPLIENEQPAELADGNEFFLPHPLLPPLLLRSVGQAARESSPFLRAKVNVAAVAAVAAPAKDGRESRETRTKAFTR